MKEIIKEAKATYKKEFQRLNVKEYISEKDFLEEYLYNEIDDLELLKELKNSGYEPPKLVLNKTLYNPQIFVRFIDVVTTMEIAENYEEFKKIVKKKTKVNIEFENKIKEFLKIDLKNKK